MIRILTIGNSFAGNATHMLPAMAAADGGVEVLIGSANLGGCSLEKHVNILRQCELFPDVRPYQFNRTGREAIAATLPQILRAEPWDYVTLQQASISSWRAESYEPWFGRLLAVVRELAPRAQPVIHQTWAYRVDAPLYAEQGIDQARMHRDLVAAYDAVAAAHDLPQIPVGQAFAEARPALGYVPDPDFDFADPPPGALPRQDGSLVVGWHWVTGNTPDGNAHLAIDPKHCNDLGLYLGAATWWERVTGRPPTTNPYRPEGMDDATLDLLRAAAHHAVASVGGPLPGAIEAAGS